MTGPIDVGLEKGFRLQLSLHGAYAVYSAARPACSLIG